MPTVFGCVPQPRLITEVRPSLHSSRSLIHRSFENQGGSGQGWSAFSPHAPQFQTALVGSVVRIYVLCGRKVNSTASVQHSERTEDHGGSTAAGTHHAVVEDHTVNRQQGHIRGRSHNGIAATAENVGIADQHIHRYTHFPVLGAKCGAASERKT